VLSRTPPVDLLKVAYLSATLTARTDDWRSGALAEFHYGGKLGEACSELEKLEASGIPAGWVRSWEVRERRYYFAKPETGETAWSLPPSAFPPSLPTPEPIPAQPITAQPARPVRGQPVSARPITAQPQQQAAPKPRRPSKQSRFGSGAAAIAAEPSAPPRPPAQIAKRPTTAAAAADAAGAAEPPPPPPDDAPPPPPPPDDDPPPPPPAKPEPETASAPSPAPEPEPEPVVEPYVWPTLPEPAAPAPAVKPAAVKVIAALAKPARSGGLGSNKRQLDGLWSKWEAVRVAEAEAEAEARARAVPPTRAELETQRQAELREWCLQMLADPDARLINPNFLPLGGGGVSGQAVAPGAWRERVEASKVRMAAASSAEEAARLARAVVFEERSDRESEYGEDDLE